MNIQNFRLPSYEEIPNVGLYLEQTAAYINSFLAVFPELELTPSMISNYVKKGLIPRSVKKLYYRDQIADLIVIAFAKTVLSMDNIQKLLYLQKNSESIDDGYDQFCIRLQTVFSDVFEKKQQSTASETSLFSSEEQNLLNNVILAITFSLYLEKHFDQFEEKENK